MDSRFAALETRLCALDEAMSETDASRERLDGQLRDADDSRARRWKRAFARWTNGHGREARLALFVWTTLAQR